MLDVTGCVNSICHTLNYYKAIKSALLSNKNGTYLYIYEMWTFDLWPLGLVESNISVLHSLQEKGCEFFFAKKSLNVPNVKMFSIFFWTFAYHPIQGAKHQKNKK